MALAVPQHSWLDLLLARFAKNQSNSQELWLLAWLPNAECSTWEMGLQWSGGAAVSYQEAELLILTL